MSAQPGSDQVRRINRRALLAVSVAGASALLSGCGLKSDSENSGFVPVEAEPVLPWLTVVVTTPVLGDIIRSIGGSRVAVRTMMPPSADPRRFVPGPSAGDVFVGADVVVRHGMGLEPALDELLAAAMNVPVVTATESVPAGSVMVTASGSADPYVWHDPTLMPWLVSRLHQALLDTDDNPVHGATWDTNSVTFLNQIALADAYVERRLSRVPAERRVLATANATFRYFGRRYGFETLALLDDTIPFATEPEVERFAGELVAQQPTVVFPDASVTLTQVQAAILQAGATGPIRPLGGLLYGSGLGTGNAYASRYLGMIRQNADRIVAALG